VARSWTWTKGREDRISIMDTDRHLSSDGEGTRLEVAVTFGLEHPWRNPLAVVLNRLIGNSAAQLELEHSLHAMADHLEGRHRAASFT
jgi:hypothetical protein